MHVSSHTVCLYHGASPQLGKARYAIAAAAVTMYFSIVSLPVSAQVGPAEVAAGQVLPLAEPTTRDKTITKLIASLMPKYHVSTEQLDDRISQRALDLFLDALDGMKLYFYQSDIDEFRRQASSIDDMVKSGDLSFAHDVFKRFTARVDERIAVAEELLAEPFDFDKDEEIIVEPDATSYAKTPEESRDRWRRQIKYALLVLKDDGKEGEEAINQLRRRYARYARRWKSTDSDDLLELFLTSVTMGYDPHSTYMSPGSLEDFTITMSLQLDGIGAQLREKDGNTVVTRIIPGGAASKHGKLKADDVIVTVGQGTDGDPVDIIEMPLDDVVDLIRGKAGTLVRLGVKQGGVGQVEEFLIERARIQLEESAARGKVIEHKLGDGRARKIGYINLPSFYLDMEGAKDGRQNHRSSTDDVRRILDDFRAQGVEGVVLDLSKNGGGSLTEAINLTGLFIDRGPVVQVRNANGSVQPYDDENSGTAWDGPLVVMTSKLSASASEILAGAIKDYGRGIVVGDPATHGKGTVQTLMDIGQQLFRTRRQNFGALKVTLQQFYLPDGDSTQRVGVAADVVLPSITAHMDIGEGDLKYALEHDSVARVEHQVYKMVPPDLLGQLRRNSESRVKQDTEFADLIRRTELYLAQKERDTASLDETEFMKRRKELESAQEDEEDELADQLSTEIIYRDNYYNREVLNIVHEYVDGLHQQNLARAG